MDTGKEQCGRNGESERAIDRVPPPKSVEAIRCLHVANEHEYWHKEDSKDKTGGLEETLHFSARSDAQRPSSGTRRGFIAARPMERSVSPLRPATRSPTPSHRPHLGQDDGQRKYPMA